VLLQLFKCHTLGGFAHFLRFVLAATHQQWQSSCWAAFPRDQAFQRVRGYKQFVPNAWLSIALSAPAEPHPPGPSSLNTVHTLMERLGWKVDEGGGQEAIVIPLASLSVRMAYRMLLQPNVDMRLQRWKAFIAEASDIDVAAVDDAGVRALQKLTALIWQRVKWNNTRKQLFWQMCVNGLPTTASRDTGRSCYCDTQGHQCPDRKHHLWDCAAAAAVVSELCKCLGINQLQRKHVWLMELPEQMLPPHDAACGAGVKRAVKEVWVVVCLAALQAMWITAKKVMGTNTRDALAAQPRGLHVVVTEGVVVQFWELMHEFASYSKVSGSWRRLLPADTPFLHFPHVDRRLQVNNTPRMLVA
jgi:hypothetical protein